MAFILQPLISSMPRSAPPRLPVSLRRAVASGTPALGSRGALRPGRGPVSRPARSNPAWLPWWTSASRPRPFAVCAKAQHESDDDSHQRPFPADRQWRQLAGVCLTAGAMALSGPGNANALSPPSVSPPDPPALVAPAPARAAPGILAADPGPGRAPREERLSPEERQVVDVFRENTPSVVNITSLARVSRGGYNSLDVLEVPQGTGTGVVWDRQGRVVTNFHVVKQASDVLVTLADGSVFGADLLGFDADKDVAVLQLGPPPSAAAAAAQKMGTPAQKLPPVASLRPIVVGASSDLVVGQTVYAIGNPFGLDHTLTSGIISGLGRELGSGNTGRPIKGVVQTDAAINPGNSGGPLLDRSGDLIGINTAIVGQSSGVGFAIPVDTVKAVVDQVIKYGEIRRPILGITIAPETMLRKFTDSGVLVMDVPEGSPAAAAGVVPTRRDPYGRYVMGDIIVGVNGQPVRGSGDLFGILDDYKVSLEVLRAQDPYEPLRRIRKSVKVTLAARVTKFNQRGSASGFE